MQALGSLGVEEPVIPVIPEPFDTWTKVFGFKALKKSKREAMKSMSIIVFPGTNMLQKPLYKNQVADNNLSLVADDNPVECITVVNETMMSKSLLHAFGFQVVNGIPIEIWFDDCSDQEHSFPYYHFWRVNARCSTR
ncbi:hypothetical protein Tco_1464120, partial [Tanacetum coccineum]